MKIIFPLIVLLSTIKPMQIYIQKGDIYLHLKNEIKFDNNNVTLQSNAKNSLNEIALQLLDRPSLKIEISSHTNVDAKRVDAINITTNRANNIKDYLISKGVSSRNLIIKGSGFDEPLVTCVDFFKCTIKEKNSNRRVRFKILDGDLGKHKIMRH